jgi:hypothetical protein
MSRTKLLAAAVLVAGGLAAGAWARLVPQAGAQAPPPNPPAGKVERLAEGGLLDLAVRIGSAPAPAWEFKYYAPAPPLSLGSIEQAAATYATDGWEYAGAVKLTYVSEGDEKRIEAADPAQLKRFGAATRGQQAPLMAVDVLVFKRPARAKVAAAELLFDKLVERAGPAVTAGELLARVQEKVDQPNTPPAVQRLVQMRALEAQIAVMQQKLDDLRKANKKSAVLTAKDLGAGTDLRQVMTALVALADARYGAEGRKQRLSFSHGKVGGKTTPDGGHVLIGDDAVDGLTIEGDPDAVDWLVEVARKLKPGVGK